MNSVLANQPHAAPHLRQQSRLSPTRSFLSNSNMMNNRKRKIEDDGDNDDRMSASPSNSPALSSQPLPNTSTSRNIKRVRTNLNGRPLALPRLLETLTADEMRTVLQSICERHVEIGNEVVTTAPRPSVTSTLDVLHKYEENLRSAFPYGGRSSSDYTYNRVRQPLSQLLDALKDYTPHFLPPNEIQHSTSLTYLDGATEIINRLPEWDSFQHNRHKHEAYEEIAKAWALTIREAAKRAGGIQLQYGGWDARLAKHNELSGGRMQEAMQELRGCLGWIDASSASGQANASSGSNNNNNAGSIRDQLFNGTLFNSVRVGPF